MASITFSGQLDQAMNEAAAEGNKILFIPQQTVGEVLPGAASELVVESDGSYSITLAYNTYSIYHYSDVTKKKTLIANGVVVSADTAVSTIPDLIGSTVPVTEDSVLTIQGYLTEAQESASAAAESEETVTNRVAAYEVESTEYLINVFDGSSLETGDVVRTLGYSSAGDGGGAEWVKTSETDTASQSPSDLSSCEATDINGDKYSICSKVIFTSMLNSDELLSGALTGSVAYKDGEWYEYDGDEWKVNNINLSGKNQDYLIDAWEKLYVNTEAVTIVCVGDSMTAGQDTNSDDIYVPSDGRSASVAAVQYPSALEDLINDLTDQDNVVINRGWSGDTTEMSYNRWTENPSADVAHIMLGINDSNGVNGATYESYIAYYELLIQQYIRWGCGVVLHTTTPTLFNIQNPKPQRWSIAVNRLAKKYGCPVFDSPTVIKYASYDGIYSDDTHFNSHGYYKYARSVCGFILYGAWARPVQGVVGQTLINPGELNNNGFKVPGGGGMGYNYSNSYMETGQITQFNGSRKFVYCFYMDTERMDVSVIGQMTSVNVEVYPLLADQYTGDDRAEKSVNKIGIRSQFDTNLEETTSYQVGAAKNASNQGKMAKIATLYGKGWKVISMYLDSDITGTYASCLVLSPRDIRDLNAYTDDDGAVINAGKVAPIVYQYPYSAPGEDSVLPSAAALPTEIEIPCPKGLLMTKYGPANFIDCTPVEVKIFSTTEDYWITFILTRTSSGNTLSIQHVERGDAATETALELLSASIVSYEWDTSTDAHSTTESESISNDGNAIYYLKLEFDYTISTYYNIIVSGVEKADGKTWI